MSFAEDVEIEVKRIFREQWTVTAATVVPETDSIALESNVAKEIASGVVLYSDLKQSTALVESKSRGIAAEVYRTFLYGAAQIIRSEGGEITAYDGDRVMAVFMGTTPNADAAVAALKINHAVKKIINPALVAQYGAQAYQVSHVTGVDASPLFVARAGVRGDNDLVWIGRAANYAAKLTEMTSGVASYITGAVFDAMGDRAKLGGNPERSMWEERTWTSMNGMRIFRSNWTYAI
jgi:class 3 adenylate cyclase